MKVIAGRRKDWDDIENLIEIPLKLDSKRVVKWCREFTELLNVPERMQLMEECLKRHGK